MGTTLSINYYNHNFISGLLEQNNSQQMKEINYELNGLYDKVNQIFITFNNEQLYEMFRYQPHLSDFEQMKQRLDYEHEVKETINGNNMQSVVTGVIFYINEDKKCICGKRAHTEELFFSGGGLVSEIPTKRQSEADVRAAYGGFQAGKYNKK